jgi:hypothetical protein
MGDNIKYDAVEQNASDLIGSVEAEKKRLDEEFNVKKANQTQHTADRINKRKDKKEEVHQEAPHETPQEAHIQVEAVSIQVDNDKVASPPAKFSYKNSIRQYLVQTKSTNKIIIKKPNGAAAIFISIGRRIFTFLPLLVSLLNTLTKVYSLAAKLSSKTPGSPTYEYLDGMVFKTCDYSNFFSNSCSNAADTNQISFFCDASGSSIESVTLQCSFTSQTAFVGFISIWCCLFGVYILYMFLMTVRYSTWDLRYYIAEQHYKMGAVTTIWKVLSIGLTLASGGYSFYSVKSQNQEYAATSNDAELILSTILFMIFNFSGIMKYCKISTSLLGLVDHPMNKFPEFIPINYVKEPSIVNFYGIMTSSNDVFSILEKDIAKSFVENDRELLQKYGDPDKIIEACKTMEIL